jgi:hypothetical protein
MASSLRGARFVFFSGEAGHGQAGYKKPEEAEKEPLPGPSGGKMEPEKGRPHPQHQTAQPPEGRPWGGNTFLNRHPETAKKHRSEQNTGDP